MRGDYRRVSRMHTNKRLRTVRNTATPARAVAPSRTIAEPNYAHIQKLIASRRQRVVMLCAFIGALLILLGQRAFSAPIVTSVDSIGINVTDLDRAISFYTDVLGFEKVGSNEYADENAARTYGVFGMHLRTATLKLGDEQIELMEFLAPRGRPRPADSKSNDGWFQHIAIIVSDMDRAYAQLRAHHVEHASSGPQVLPSWNPNAGGIAAFYFRDPDGNYLEILHFPDGKGASKWHQPTHKLFLGIDHTAIVVADTEASLRFYRDSLGFMVAGTSENYGPEQEHLNNVFGARLRITALRASDGPGVELLEYLAPRTGRPMPIDTHANDDWHWQINTSADVSDADSIVRRNHFAYVSPGAIQTSPGRLQLMVLDPDGHALMFNAINSTAQTLSSTSH